MRGEGADGTAVEARRAAEMDVLSYIHSQAIFINQKSSYTIPYKTPHNLQTLVRVSQKSTDFGLTRQLFDEIPISNTFAWNNLIQTNLIDGDSHSAVSIYRQMLLRGVRLDKHTLPRILTAARHTGCLFFGKQVHGHAVKLGLSSDSYVISALLELYGRLDGADAANLVFCKSPRRNPVSWTLISKLYITEEKPGLAVDMFKQMVESEAEIDPLALVTAIVACGMLKSVQEGRNVHEIAKRCGLEADVLVSNSLLKMYIDCGNIKEARAVFNRMHSRDVISWTEMLRGYVKNGGFNEGLKLFRRMVTEGLKPDALSISSILPACGRGAAHKQGKEIHAYLLRNGIDLNVTVQNAVLDMYVKSGFIESAEKIFAGMEDRDAISWTVMILGYSLHCQGELGVELFCEMEKNSSLDVDEIAYAAVLHACSTAGLVKQGRFYFNSITAPKIRHYAFMVALLSRAGLFDEARVLMEEHRLEGHVEVLRALLDGCRIHRNMPTAKRVIEQLCDLQPLNPDNYVLLSNWYSGFGKWDMVDKLRETIRDMGLKPRKAYSWIEFKNKIHVFGTGDVSHPRSEKIYWQLQSLMRRMEEEGIELKSDFSLHDVCEERECVPIGHSELLATSFGLISTEAGATIRVTKNLRICETCHGSAKAISKIVEREIIIKDPSCFHHFKDGFCSCGDIW